MAMVSAGKDVRDRCRVRQSSRGRIRINGECFGRLVLHRNALPPFTLFKFLVPLHVDSITYTTTMSLEPLPVFAARSADDLEPIDPEILSLIAADDIDTSMTQLEGCNEKFVDEFTPLNPTSTPTAVDAFNPGFSKREVQDLMNLLAPEALKIPTMVRSYSEPIKKIGKRTKKCTYAARRREVTFLRQESVVLEKRLIELRKHRVVSPKTREYAARANYELAKSEEENKRLRALVSSQEAKIRQADAYMASTHHQRATSF
ncbi:hypothetical protein GN958_ATG07130 [Phytophthora infestans]|uniref:Uncharacterized protein n=1 Tax=Phytophthora infestans TaxID=4787 RepID=A0A8S9URU2_PHYIN|nr:hypothetical protein GN958_ATG07130 [Phytophthora infestans]